jgi:cell fate regulator YaaT (PSP1 superfamily)
MADGQHIAVVNIDDSSPIRSFCPPEVAIREEDLCVVDVDGVLEYGPVASIEPPLPKDDLPTMPRLIRRATLQDQTQAKDVALKSHMAVSRCEETAKRYGLDMRMVQVRFSFDQKMLLILFRSEGRVDFRGMVKDLSAEFNVRVRMKQIGVRDEAAVIGGMGPCGRELCCCKFLRKFESINVRMAKVQRTSMNPNTISGMCGRLKCCMRYEHDQYCEADALLPHDGGRVRSPEGPGVVIDKDVMRQRIKVRLDDRRVLDFHVDELSRA